MFFSTEILGKRQRSGLGLYWLVAIGANKSTITKVSRNELLNAKLTDACMVLAQPPEPLSLRLISALLLGIVRVYGQQCSSFEVQVHHISQLVRKPFSVTEEEKIVQHQKRSRSRSLKHARLSDPEIVNNFGKDLITISYQRPHEQIQEFFNFEEPDPFLFDPKFHEGEPDDPYMGFGKILIGNKPTQTGFRNDEASSSHDTDPFVSKPSEISLSEGSLALGPRGEDDPAGLQSFLEGGLQFDDLGGEGDAAIDLGILPQPTAARVRQPSSRFGIESEVGRGNQARQRHTSIIGFRMSSVEPQRMQDEDRENRFELNDQDRFEFEPASHFNDEAQVPNINPEGELTAALNPTSLQENIAQKRKASPHPRLEDRRKFARVVIDLPTSLSARDLITMRQNYPLDNLQRASRNNDRRRNRILQTRAEELVYGIPGYFQASKLRQFWLRSVKVPTGRIDSKKATGRLEGERTDEDVENLRLDIPPEEFEDRDAFQDLQGSEDHEGSFVQPPANLPWQNFGENQHQIPPFSREQGPDQERIEEIDEEVIGRHRAPSYESSIYGRGGSHVLPWNRPSLAPEGAIEGENESDHGRHGNYGMATMDTSGARSATHVRRETPVQLRRRSSLLSLSREPTRISSTPQPIRSSLGPKNIQGNKGQELDTDGTNFISWAWNQVDDPSDFLFSDVAPVTSTSRQIAAQTFIKVLSLANQELIQVIEQDEPYGEIRLKFLAHSNT